ncbi:MAG TPA: MarR family transcriptional regulator [Usitatibacter sp.]|jgi:DNA-binding MarR family transcriptional regulator|nr:MarR family transcriptional regulator [Usitatibacter sp.]
MSIYDPATYDIRKAVPPMLGRVRAVFIAALEERLAPFDIKPVDYVVLASLANDVADTASSVCSIMSHDPGAMTRKIDALEQRGLVRRVRSAEDRRAIKLELTPEGRKVFPKMLAVAVGVANDFLRGFSKAEVRQFEDMLQRILDNADEMGFELLGKEARR